MDGKWADGSGQMHVVSHGVSLSNRLSPRGEEVSGSQGERGAASTTSSLRKPSVV